MANYGVGSVKLPPDFDLQAQNAASEWKFWKTSFEDYLIATGQHEAADKIKLSMLRNIIGTESARIMSTFNVADEELDKYKCTIELIDKYVNPRVNECFERYNFLKRSQKEGESFEHFLTECRHLVKSCNYNEIDPNQSAEDKSLRDKIVMGITDPVTREALLRIDQLTLDKAVQFCRTSEQSKHQSLQFKQEAGEVNVVKKSKGKFNNSNKYHNKNKNSTQNVKSDGKFKCKRCRCVHGPRECPAFGKPCTNCGILNHFAVACRVKNVKNVNRDDANEDSSSDEFCVNNINIVKYNDNNNMWDEIIQIENKKIKVKLDTGAEINVMPSKTFKSINKQFKIRPTGYVLKAFEGTQAKPVGIVNLLCKHKNREMYEDFVVVEGANQILLSGQTCVKLDLVKRIYNVKVNDKIAKNKEEFITKNQEIFHGPGRFAGEYKITTKKEFEAVSYPPTKVPIAIRNELKQELDRLVKRNAIAQVEEIDPRASINRMVIVEKNNGKIRLCLDPSDLNSQIVRKPRLMHNIEEVCSKMRGKKFFTVFDLAEGYHHLKLDEESSWKCCFATPFGIYRFTVLPYGLSDSQDLFQEVVEKNFEDIKNVQVCHDDMIVTGTTQEQHDAAVEQVVQRAKEVGAKFNKEKFQYCQRQVKFMGQTFSEKGMEVDTDRVKSLRKLESPKDKTELQRIIGSFNYVRRYIPSMANHMHILCELLKSKVEWQWLPKHQETFERLKDIVSSAPALTPFDHTKKIILQCDASKNGIGCCMFQEHENEILKLVACASRKMNDHEINYSQTEKEMLAIYYATQKFHDFIYRANINVQTDHKPIVSIMKKPICKIGSVRLQRLRLKLLKYSLNVYYVPGKSIHFADMLSRSSLKESSFDPEMLDMIHYVSKHLPMSDERKNELRIESNKDEVLSKISEYYYNGWPKEKIVPPTVKPFYKLKDSIYVEAGIVFVDDKIILPKNIRPKITKILHKGHIGVSKTINRARKLFYWPNMSNEISTYIKQCRICEKHMPSNRKEPLLPHSTPRLRFNKIGSDILEFGGNAFLIVIDYFSHWIEMIPLKDKTSNSVIDSFQSIFTRYGYPEHIIADNLPFISVKCNNYYRNKDINILTCSPHYHQSNGLAEKGVSIGKQILRKSREENSDYRELMMEYNNTPIISLNASPSQILHSRNLRSQLPMTSKNLEPEIQTQIYARLNQQKQVTKSNYDKSARKRPIEYTKGDRVVIKSNKEKIWYKAIILEKAKEPRSYWVRKEGNNKIVRRNTSQIKPSITETENKEFVLQPELYPEETTTVKKPPTRVATNKVVNVNPQSNQNNNKQKISRIGRPVKAPRRLNL